MFIYSGWWKVDMRNRRCDFLSACGVHAGLLLSPQCVQSGESLWRSWHWCSGALACAVLLAWPLWLGGVSARTLLVQGDPSSVSVAPLVDVVSLLFFDAGGWGRHQYRRAVSYAAVGALAMGGCFS